MRFDFEKWRKDLGINCAQAADWLGIWELTYLAYEGNPSSAPKSVVLACLFIELAQKVQNVELDDELKHGGHYNLTHLKCTCTLNRFLDGYNKLEDRLLFAGKNGIKDLKTGRPINSAETGI